MRTSLSLRTWRRALVRARPGPALSRSVPDRAAARIGSEPILVESRTNAGDDFVEKGRTSVQAGRVSNQGPIADVTVASSRPRGCRPDRGDRRHAPRPHVERDAARRRRRRLRARRHPHPAGDVHRRLPRPVQGQHRPVRVREQRRHELGDRRRPLRLRGRPPQAATSRHSRAATTACGRPERPVRTNNWATTIPTGDPRLVTVFLTDAIPESQGASDDYPITGFAAFYVTGWNGAPSRCDGVNGDRIPTRRHAGRQRLGPLRQARAALGRRHTEHNPLQRERFGGLHRRSRKVRASRRQVDRTGKCTITRRGGVRRRGEVREMEMTWGT